MPILLPVIRGILILGLIVLCQAARAGSQLGVTFDSVTRTVPQANITWQGNQNFTNQGNIYYGTNKNIILIAVPNTNQVWVSCVTNAWQKGEYQWTPNVTIDGNTGCYTNGHGYVDLNDVNGNQDGVLICSNVPDFVSNTNIWWLNGGGSYVGSYGQWSFFGSLPQPSVFPVVTWGTNYIIVTNNQYLSPGQPMDFDNSNSVPAITSTDGDLFLNPPPGGGWHINGNASGYNELIQMQDNGDGYTLNAAAASTTGGFGEIAWIYQNTWGQGDAYWADADGYGFFSPNNLSEPGQFWSGIGFGNNTLGNLLIEYGTPDGIKLFAVNYLYHHLGFSTNYNVIPFVAESSGVATAGGYHVDDLSYDTNGNCSSGIFNDNQQSHGNQILASNLTLNVTIYPSNTFVLSSVTSSIPVWGVANFYSNSANASPVRIYIYNSNHTYFVEDPPAAGH